MLLTTNFALNSKMQQKINASTQRSPPAAAAAAAARAADAGADAAVLPTHAAAASAAAIVTTHGREVRKSRCKAPILVVKTIVVEH